MTFQIDAGGRNRNVEIQRTSDGVRVLVDGHEYPVNVARVGHTWSLIIGSSDAGRSYQIAIVEQGPGDLIVYVNGQAVPVSVANLQRSGSTGIRRGVAGGADGKQGLQRVVAPMPGRIVKLLVKAGDVVSARQGLVIVEAMKMENELRSSKAGTVTEVYVAEGASVEANAVLLLVE